MPPADSGSEGENGEKPVRERLKQTKIDKSGEASSHGEHHEEDEDEIATEDTKYASAADGPPHKSTKKRSLEDKANAEPSSTTAQGLNAQDASDVPARKRTREHQESSLASGEDQMENGDAPVKGDSTPPGAISPRRASRASPAEEALLSPRRKRSRENLDPDEETREQKIPSTEGTRARRSSSEERLTRKENKNDKNTDTSTKPIFGASLKPKSVEKAGEQPQTSKSAFAASGFASLSGSTSPFGALGPPSSSTASKSPEPASKSPLSSFASPGKTSTTFGSSFAGTKSAFGSAAAVSGFGSLAANKTFGGGTTGGFGGGSRLTSFAAPKGDVKLRTNQAEKPFGAPAESESSSNHESDSDNEAGNEDGQAKEPPSKEEDPQSTKFHVQETNTGEDNEDSVFTNRAKLFQYHPDSASWKERGVGPVKLNVARSTSTPEEESSNTKKSTVSQANADNNKARFVMRNHATHKVLLNAPIFKEMSISEQNSKQLLFICPNEDGKMTTYMLRMSKEEDIKQLLRLVKGFQERM